MSVLSLYRTEGHTANEGVIPSYGSVAVRILGAVYQSKMKYWYYKYTYMHKKRYHHLFDYLPLWIIYIYIYIELPDLNTSTYLTVNGWTEVFFSFEKPVS